MLYHKSYTIPTLIIAIVLLCSVSYSADDVDSGVGIHSGAFGHAEVVDVGWYDGYSSTTQWGYVFNNLHHDEISYLIVFQYRIVEVTKAGEFVEEWLNKGDSADGDVPGRETRGTPFAWNWYYDEVWAITRTIRAEAKVEVSAWFGGGEIDIWRATACQEKTF